MKKFNYIEEFKKDEKEIELWLKSILNKEVNLDKLNELNNEEIEEIQAHIEYSKARYDTKFNDAIVTIPSSNVLITVLVGFLLTTFITYITGGFELWKPTDSYSDAVVMMVLTLIGVGGTGLAYFGHRRTVTFLNKNNRKLAYLQSKIDSLHKEISTSANNE